MKKPHLELQATTLWEYPSQHYGKKSQGSQLYAGATPSYIIWNLLKRYTRENDLIVDPMCGSGTTIDVCNDLGRRVQGFDIAPPPVVSAKRAFRPPTGGGVAPFREGVQKADARDLPLKSETVDFLFVDPPYSDHLSYSGDEKCIGRIKAEDPKYFEEMEKVIREIHRVLKPRRYMGLYISDSYKKKQGFMPIGFKIFEILCHYFKPVDIISVVRHNKSLKKSQWKKTALEQNFFLRGFNYLFVMKKE